jgi:hypothetical protein
LEIFPAESKVKSLNFPSKASLTLFKVTLPDFKVDLPFASGVTAKPDGIPKTLIDLKYRIVAWLFLTISAKLRAADPALVYFTEAAAILSGSLDANAVNKALTLLVCLVVKFGIALDGVITIACEAMNARAIKALVNLDIFTS